jgi:hypothetical protein
MRRNLATLAFAAALVGCGTNLSTLTPAETTPAAHVRAAAGAGVSVPAGGLSALLDSGDTLAGRAAAGEALTDTEREELLRASVVGLLAMPSVNPELQLRVGLHERVDVGLRLGAGSVRLDGRVGLVVPRRAREGLLAVSVGLGLAYYAFSLPVPSFAEDVVQVDDYKRYELDVPLLFGWSTDVWRVWTGPKLVFTSYSVGLTLDAPATTATAEASGMQTFLAAQVGAALGFRYGWVVLELTVAYGLGGADVAITGRATQRVSTNDWVIYPTFGLLVEI